MGKKYYYALSDTFTGDYPNDFTTGFANTKIPIAFFSKNERDKWIESTRLLTAKPITRKEAEKIAKWERGEYYGFSCQKVKPVRLIKNGDFIVLKKTVN